MVCLVDAHPGRIPVALVDAGGVRAGVLRQRECILRERPLSGRLNIASISREFTQPFSFLGGNAIFLVHSEGFEGPKKFPELCYASSNESPAQKAAIMSEPCPKREVPNPGKPVGHSQP